MSYAKSLAPLRAPKSKLLLFAVCALQLATNDASARPKAAKAPASSPPAAAVEQAPSNSAPEPVPLPPPAAAKDDKPQLTPAAQPADTLAQPTAPTQDTPGAQNAKLAELRADVTALMDDLVEARARTAMLGKTLFKTQVRVRVQNLAAPEAVLAKLVLKLDGAAIFRADVAALSGDDARQVFQGFIAPGAHVLSAEIEQRSRDDANYGYLLHDTYRFQALREKRSELTLILDDDSDLAAEFPDDGAGEYDVRIKLRVKTKDLNEE